MNTSTVPDTPAPRTAFERARAEASTPVEHGSERYAELEAWGEAHPGWNIENLSPEHLGELYGHVFGPDMATFKGRAPEWASESHSDRKSSITAAGNPVLIWSTADLLDTDGVTAAVIRMDEFDVDSDTLIEGQPTINVYGGEPIEIKSPEAARRIAKQLLAAAEHFEAILKEASREVR